MRHLSLQVGDQKGGAKSLTTASGVLTGIDHLIEWTIFAAAWASETGFPYEVAQETLRVRGFTPAPIV